MKLLVYWSGYSCLFLCA